jgi:hypothetical protein
MKKILVLISILGFSLSIGGCAVYPPYAHSGSYEYGYPYYGYNYGVQPYGYRSYPNYGYRPYGNVGWVGGYGGGGHQGWGGDMAVIDT